MPSQIQCPQCGMFQVTPTHIQTIEPTVRTITPIDPQRESRWVMIVLLLSLTIIGLPIAYWLCKQLEKENPLPEQAVRKYTYHCRLCGYAWTWRTDEPLPPSTPKNMAPRHIDNNPALSPRPNSFFSNLVTWWLKV